MAQIRVWKLGSFEHKMSPTKEAVDRLRGLLDARKPGEDLDLIWGPGLECMIINTGQEYYLDPKSNEVVFTHSKKESVDLVQYEKMAQ